jgi:hypothetical protein
VSGDLVDMERERRNTPPSTASELVGGCDWARDAAFALAGRIHFGRAPGEQKRVSVSEQRCRRTQKQSRHEDHGNTERIRNAETGAPHTVYTCNLVPFMLTGNKGEGQAKYALKVDAEGGTCTDR